MAERKYPIGIQTFLRIIRENYLYVDKTDLVWRTSGHGGVDAGYNLCL